MKLKKKGSKTRTNQNENNNTNNESFKTIDSSDSIITKTLPDSKKIKKTSKKTTYLKQKKVKLKILKKIKLPKQLTRERKEKLKASQEFSPEKKDIFDQEESDIFYDDPSKLLDNKQQRTRLIISRSLFGDENLRSSRRSSISSVNNEQKKIVLDKPVQKSPIKNVLVPNWRPINFKPTYKMEGTENLNDDFYLKRHLKPENEERLIKKRDLRRQKEELMKLRMLNRNQKSLVNNSRKLNKSQNVKVNPEDDVNKEIIERKCEEIDLDDIEYIIIIDDTENSIENETEKTSTPQEINQSQLKLPNEKHKKTKQKLKRNSENSKQLIKKNRSKSFPSLPLNPLNDNLTNISINIKSSINKNKKMNMTVYDDLDSDYVDPSNSENIKNSRPNKRKTNHNSNSFVNSLKLPAKKRTRLS
ncbi:unnamed protein product [Brachionus calyciflorus]|uniref:PEHE domain-containing protein n=1 Tax=Brachionus calyciflorus TaxID=104777 RepID=A0A813NSQ1_9BILA|nr:unnamed protein product [Brachionus calyciflorus]